MTSNTAHHGGVLVVDPAVDDGMAERAVILGGRTPCSVGIPRRIELGEQLKRLKNFTHTECVKRLASDDLKRLSQQDKADIAVFGPGSGIGGQRNLKGLADQLFFVARGLKELDVCRQARRVRQKHAQGDLPAARIVTGKVRKQFNERLFKLKLLPVVQDHACGRRGYYLGDRSEIVKCVSFDRPGAATISEMPKAFMRDQPAVVSNSNRRAGKCLLRDAGTQHVKSGVKLFVLPVKGRRQNVVGTLVQKMSSCCFCFRFITHSVQR